MKKLIYEKFPKVYGHYSDNVTQQYSEAAYYSSGTSTVSPLTLASFTALFMVEKMRKMERKLMPINMTSRTVSKPRTISKESVSIIATLYKHFLKNLLMPGHLQPWAI